MKKKLIQTDIIVNKKRNTNNKKDALLNVIFFVKQFDSDTLPVAGKDKIEALGKSFHLRPTKAF